jgi:hypothetical protein
LKQIPRIYFQNLSAKLKTLGYSSCDSDPFLFVPETCICLIYVDDTLLFARQPDDIAAVANGIDLEEEDDTAASLAFGQASH